MLGIIGGTSLPGIGGKDLKEVLTKNKYGGSYLLSDETILFLPRHGEKHNIPAHRINHRANILALKDAGATEILCINSVGSLKKEITPGSFALPHYYMSFTDPPTFYDDCINHVTPGLDMALRGKISSAAKSIGLAIINEAVYAQVRGPRLETRSEIAFLKDYSDLVGMTLASEATLCNEADIPCCSLCTVDNYANGISDKTPYFRDIIENAGKKREILEGFILKIIENLN